ncbi:UNVERIFIED_CONTAM: putative xyloglucan endotransglucosylase/hydrolase protein 32 [Sesamum calycinum]|uniref:Xyloglucan endotransglucosylase/hydrolase n=1 Tax=Sesamum calycinum TaxID=2727403 RepID=A0AAW2NTC8_9LAMI
MAFQLLPLIILLIAPLTANAGQWPPSPGYYPSTRFRSMSFYQGYRNLWGPGHQNVDNNGITIWLDRNSGSGFKSVKPFRSGYFGASIKLQPGYTAGVITAFYLSNNEAHPGFHDEVDIEFLGTTFGKPYTLQTNVFFVDDVPIRRYPRKSATTFPLRPMWVYGSIWDASSWATEDGKYKADYRYQPFVGKFTNFKASGCTAYSPAWCRPVSASPYRSGGLTGQQNRAMQWVQSNYMVYDYCRDYKRDHSLTPECWR